MLSFRKILYFFYSSWDRLQLDVSVGLSGEASKDQESSEAETRKKSENDMLNLKGF